MPCTAPGSGGLLLCLMAAASIGSGSALALERIDLAAAGACDGASTLDHRMLFSVDAGAFRESSGQVLALARKGEGLSAVAASQGHEVAAKMLPAAARGGSDGTGAAWLRSADGAPAEPGFWALLLAGFLGICAVARPRIFAS